MTSIFWVILRSIAIPIVAYYLLKDTFLGERGAILAIAIALTIVTAISVLWNILKILGNTLLLKADKVVKLILVTLIQLIAVVFVWVYFMSL